MSEAFPIATASLRRLRRAWHLFWVGWHVTGAIEHLEKMGPEGERGRLAMIDAYLRDVPSVKQANTET